MEATRISLVVYVGGGGEGKERSKNAARAAYADARYGESSDPFKELYGQLTPCISVSLFWISGGVQVILP